VEGYESEKTPGREPTEDGVVLSIEQLKLEGVDQHCRGFFLPSEMGCEDVDPEWIVGEKRRGNGCTNDGKRARCVPFLDEFQRGFNLVK
jgi:hypothetical protein